ncbi:MAG: sulfite exporter TauE/SafE family protein [Glycocaulis sp.]
MEQYLIYLLTLLAVGAFAGLIAGLFGIGGGVVMVPAMYYTLVFLGYPEHAMHAAVGTSLAVIVITSARSVLAHAKKGAVDFGVLKTWCPWIVLGALAGSAVAGAIPTRGLVFIFAITALLLSLQFFFGRADWKIGDDLPGQPVRALLAGTIGIMSALMGIGGGVFGVTLLTVFGRSIHVAVATAAGFGVAIGFPAALGFVITGWNVADRAPFSLGFVSMPGFALLAITAVFVTPLGASLAHRLNAARLRQAFAIGLALVALNMLRSAVWG